MKFIQEIWCYLTHVGGHKYRYYGNNRKCIFCNKIQIYDFNKDKYYNL